MKIISFRAENIKRLTAVSITPEGNVIEITGKNGQGKTPVLDAIWWALKGEKAVQETPIRKGQETAIIELNLGRLMVTRKFKVKKEGGHATSLIVETEDGIKAQNPQKILDAIYGELTFDPLSFTRQKPKDQFDTLKQFVPGVDFEEIDNANAKEFADRTDVNRRAGELRAQAAGIQIPELEISERVDESDLVKALALAGEHNANIIRTKADRQAETSNLGRNKSGLAEKRAKVLDLRAQADALEADANAHEGRIAEAEQKFASLPALLNPIDTAAAQEAINAARNTNALIDAATRASEAKSALTAQAAEQEAKSQALTDAMKARTKGKEEAVAAAKIPVAGISFGDGAILLGGVPFDQASDAEQLRASIEIAAAMNPRLRIIRVRDGSLLDTDSMKLLAELADRSDMQVWIETVSSGRPGAILIEDGHVSGAVQQAAE